MGHTLVVDDALRDEARQVEQWQRRRNQCVDEIQEEIRWGQAVDVVRGEKQV